MTFYCPKRVNEEVGFVVMMMGGGEINNFYTHKFLARSSITEILWQLGTASSAKIISQKIDDPFFAFFFIQTITHHEKCEEPDMCQICCGYGPSL